MQREERRQHGCQVMLTKKEHRHAALSLSDPSPCILETKWIPLLYNVSVLCGNTVTVIALAYMHSTLGAKALE